MGSADIASCKHQVIDIPGIQTTVRDAVGLTQAALLQVHTLAGHGKATGQVVVDLPTAIGNGIVKVGMILHIMLRQDIVAYIAAAFPLAGQETDPFQLPVLCTVVAPVLDMVPCTEGDLQQLITNFFRIVDAVLHAAQLHPVEIGVDSVEIMGLVVHLFVCLKGISPCRRGKGNGVICLSCLDHDAHAHGMVIGNLQTEFLTEFFLCFPSHAELGTGQTGQNTVAGAIDEDLCVYGMPGVCSQLEAVDADDVLTVHFCIAAGAVEHQVDVLFKTNHLIEDAVPDAEITLGVAIHILQK